MRCAIHRSSLSVLASRANVVNEMREGGLCMVKGKEVVVDCLKVLSWHLLVRHDS